MLQLGRREVGSNNATMAGYVDDAGFDRLVLILSKIPREIAGRDGPNMRHERILSISRNLRNSRKISM